MPQVTCPKNMKSAKLEEQRKRENGQGAENIAKFGNAHWKTEQQIAG